MDIPAMVMGSLCSILLWPLQFVRQIGRYESSYIAAATLLILGSVQWLVIGYFIEKHFHQAFSSRHQTLR